MLLQRTPDFHQDDLVHVGRREVLVRAVTRIAAVTHSMVPDARILSMLVQEEEPSREVLLVDGVSYERLNEEIVPQLLLNLGRRAHPTAKWRVYNGYVFGVIGNNAVAVILKRTK